MKLKPKLTDQQVKLYPKNVDADIFLMSLTLAFIFLTFHVGMQLEGAQEQKRG